MKQTTANAMSLRAKINNYAKDITYQETVNAVKEVIHEIHF